MGLFSVEHLGACSLGRTYLDTGLREVDFHGQLLAREHVRVVRLREDSFQGLELPKDHEKNRDNSEFSHLPEVYSYIFQFSS